MTETTTEVNRQKFKNPDGRVHPVFHSIIVNDKGRDINRTVQIVESNNGNLAYIAIDPQTQKEVRMGAVQWNEVYRSLLNKEPPQDLSDRVKRYYEIKARETAKKARLANPIYSPFEDPPEDKPDAA